MARSRSRVKKEDKDPKVNPLVDPFLDTTQQYFSDLDSVSNVWDDSVSDSFQHEITEYSRNKTKEYLESIIDIYTSYQHLLEAAENLKKWEAGFGGRLSLLDIGMLAERQMSRLFFNRDDQRL